jgi:hypothetical protein
MNMGGVKTSSLGVIVSMDAKTKKCLKCKQNQPLENFHTYISRSRGPRRRTRCRKCEIERNRNYNNTHREAKRLGYRKVKANKYEIGGDILLRFILSQRLGSYRRTTQLQSLPLMDIDTDYLISVFKQQNGLCYYSQTPLLYGHQLQVQQQNSMSLDRKYPKKGYTKGNVVLCTYQVNTMKGNLSIDEFRLMIHELQNKSVNW